MQLIFRTTIQSSLVGCLVQSISRLRVRSTRLVEVPPVLPVGVHTPATVLSTQAARSQTFNRFRMDPFLLALELRLDGRVQTFANEKSANDDFAASPN